MIGTLKEAAVDVFETLFPRPLELSQVVEEQFDRAIADALEHLKDAVNGEEALEWAKTAQTLTDALRG